MAPALLSFQDIVGISSRRICPDTGPLEATLERLYSDKTDQTRQQVGENATKEHYLKRAIANMTNSATRTISGADTFKLRKIV